MEPASTWSVAARADAAAAKYGKKVSWKEVLVGEKAFKETGDWLPEETVQAFRDHFIGIKRPLLTTPGWWCGIRSLNVCCVRSRLVRLPAASALFRGCAAPVKHPELVDMVIFRENIEDVYAGMEMGRRHAGGRRRSSTFLVNAEFGSGTSVPIRPLRHQTDASAVGSSV